jgi:hypothetical protein
MARQVGSAIGVAVVVVMLGTAAAHPVGAFHHVWLAEAIAGLAACLAIVVTAGSGGSARAARLVTEDVGGGGGGQCTIEPLVELGEFSAPGRGSRRRCAA